jgi:long-chain acyl-CoA synthetase
MSAFFGIMDTMNKDTIHGRFIEVSEKHRNSIAFNYFDQEWKKITYKEFIDNSRSIASYLIRSGIKKGDRIAIISDNRPGWCAAYMAILMAGGIAVPIDMQLGSDEIRNLLIDSETKIVFYSSKTEANVLKAVEGTHIKDMDLDTASFTHLPIHPFTHSPITPEDTASIIYTSGTTGKPKGVMLTHYNFCSDAEALIEAGVVTENDNVLSILPLHHTYPFMCTFLVPIFLGAAITYSPSLKGPDIVSSVKDNGVTILIGVPQLLELIRNGISNKLKQLPYPVSWIMKNLLKLSGKLRAKTDINIGKIIFKSAHAALGRQFRFFASGGARLDPAVMKDLEAIGFTVLEGYGLTETSPVVTFNPIRKRRTGSVGKPLPSVEIKIVEQATGKVLDSEKEGEITIKGPMVTKGYFKNPEATEQVLKDRWFFSGDLGYINSEGYLFITGRIKEVIVLSSGKNVYPEEVEKEYLKILLIKEICVFALEEKGREDLLHAIIVPDFDYAKQQKIGNIHEALGWEISKISNRLPSYQRIKGFTLYPETLPRTPLGKLRRFMIKDLISVQRSAFSVRREEDKTLISDETGRRVVDCIKPLLREPVPIYSNDNLELDLGLDSLKRIELVVSIENEFSIKLPEAFISDVHTVRELVEKIKKQAISYQLSAISSKEIGLSSVFSQEPSEEERKRVGLKQGTAEWFIVSLLMQVLKLIFRIFFRLEVRGIENIPDAPFIISSNHTSYLDGFVVAAGVPLNIFKKLYFHGFRKYFTSTPTALFARLAHVIPIDPETYLSKALQLSAYVIKNRRALCIFPEGGRSYDGNIMEFKKGVGILAIEMNIPVVPALIEGSFEALPRDASWPKFKKIKIVFGKPFYPSDLDIDKMPAGTDKYQFFADELRKKVLEL